MQAVSARNKNTGPGIPAIGHARAQCGGARNGTRCAAGDGSGPGDLELWRPVQSHISVWVQPHERVERDPLLLCKFEKGKRIGVSESVFKLPC